MFLRQIVILIVCGCLLQIASAKLRMAAILFRHGSRAPLSAYPNDPHKDYEWDYGLGKLTKFGITEAQTLGANLRSRYLDLTQENGKFNHSNLMVQSSSVNRCIKSAQNLISHFLPEENINIIVLPEETDYKLRVNTNCKKYLDLLDNIDINPPQNLRDMYISDNATLTELVQFIGEELDTIKKINDLYDLIYIESTVGLKQPDYIHKVFPKTLKKYSEENFRLLTHTEEMKIMRGGPLQAEIMSNARKINGNEPLEKLWMYAGHDSTIVTMARSLGVDNQVPPLPYYSSTIGLEFYDLGTDDIEVKAIYFPNCNATEPIELSIPDCKTPCRLETFVNNYQRLTTFNEVCAN